LTHQAPMRSSVVVERSMQGRPFPSVFNGMATAVIIRQHRAETPTPHFRSIQTLSDPASGLPASHLDIVALRIALFR
jgi:hypothetical protein